MTVLFPLGVRLSTWLAAAAFGGLAVSRRDTKPLVAGFAWLAGFEAVFQIVSLIFWRIPLGLQSPVFFILLGATVTVWAHKRGVRADWRFIAAAIPLIIVWVALGFHLNGHQHGMFSLHTRIQHFDATAEVLNEGAKMLWALAYLVPLTRLAPARLGVAS